MKVTFLLSGGQKIENDDCTIPPEGWSWTGILKLNHGTNSKGKFQTIHIPWSQIVAIIEEEE